ncbi:MAG TPA: hypothetical protein VNA30_01580 [Mycobacteriales bacterium]|nr:hypothetical protein [Mycobacteriales bacterium]
MRSLLRSTVLAGLTGSLIVGAAWAGVGLAPVPVPTALPGLGSDGLPGAEKGSGSAGASTVAAALAKLGAGQVLIGAAKTSITPAPERADKTRFPGAKWERDLKECVRLISDDAPKTITNVAGHLASAGSPWPENPNCIYQGGYGLGPNFPVSSYDPKLGLWVRTMAIGDGKDTMILSVVDGEGWLWDYAKKCQDCGIKQIAAALGADKDLAARGVKASSFALHATHSHTSPDFLGGWGFVPDWYMAQVTETIKATARQAVLAMEPAVLEIGSEDARAHNSERRGTYRSAEEPELNWMRGIAATGKRKGKVLATLGAFAAHPVTEDHEKGVAHADWPGYFNARVEKRFGGIGLHFMTGLGNVTGAKSEDVKTGRPSTGTALADLLPPPGRGRPAGGTDVRFAQRTWQQPVTNAPLDALGTPGFFDRQFDAMPAAVSVGKNSNAPCVSAAPQSVELPVTVARIGTDVVLTTGPGELFSNLTNTIKEKNPGQITFPLAQTNDSLGYMPQSFELDPVAMQGLGFAAGGYVFVNYEDSYAIDRCVGDMALEETLKGLAALK